MNKYKLICYLLIAMILFVKPICSICLMIFYTPCPAGMKETILHPQHRWCNIKGNFCFILLQICVRYLSVCKKLRSSDIQIPHQHLRITTTTVTMDQMIGNTNTVDEMVTSSGVGTQHTAKLSFAMSSRRLNLGICLRNAYTDSELLQLR